MHQVFDTLQFRVLRDRLYATLQAAEPEADEGFDVDVDRAGSGAGRRVAGEHARAASAGPASRVAGIWGRGSGRRRRRLALAAADGAARVDRPGGSSTPADEAALAAWLADLARPKALHDAKGPMLALRRARLAAARASRATPRWRPTSRCPASAPSTWPTSSLRYLHRELRAEEPATTGQLSFDGSTTRPTPPRR